MAGVGPQRHRKERISNRVRTGKCFGLKLVAVTICRQLIFLWLGRGHKFFTSFSRGGQSFMTKCDKRSLRSLLRQSSVTSFFDEPL